MRVNSLMGPPGIPDFYSRRRIVRAGCIEIMGRAWSGAAAIKAVEFAVDGQWRLVDVVSQRQPHSWALWKTVWDATPGHHELACRATDEAGNVQPLEAPWDLTGFGNNGVQRIHVTVTS
jgi:hypothetical protein